MKTMRLTSTLVTALLLAAAAGCVGGVDEQNPIDPTPDGGSTGGDTAKQLYKTTVHNIVQAKCSGAGCHTQPGVTGMYAFAAADGEMSYAAVTNLPILVGTYTATSAGMLTKIEGVGGHKAVTFSTDDRSKIVAWLAKESTERNNGTQPPPVDPVAKLKEWSGCLSQANFDAANMTTAWGGLATAQNQACKNCHADGLFSFISGRGPGANNNTLFFTTMTTQKDLLLKYFTVDGTGKIIINTSSFQNAGVTLETHPHFDPTTNAGMTALTKLYTDTLARQAAATCDPPRLP